MTTSPIRNGKRLPTLVMVGVFALAPADPLAAIDLTAVNQRIEVPIGSSVTALARLKYSDTDGLSSFLGGPLFQWQKRDEHGIWQNFGREKTGWLKASDRNSGENLQYAALTFFRTDPSYIGEYRVIMQSDTGKSLVSEVYTLSVTEAEQEWGLDVVFEFTNPRDGQLPIADPLIAKDGILYGSTYAGGADGFGTLFSIDLKGGSRSIHPLNLAIEGGNPVGGIAEGGDGWKYGATSTGGGFGAGTIFRFKSVNDVEIIRNLNGKSDGGRVIKPLIANTDGTILGVTSTGGTTRGIFGETSVGYAGTFFKVTPNNTFSVALDFNQSVASNGGGPVGMLPINDTSTLFSSSIALFEVSKPGAETVIMEQGQSLAMLMEADGVGLTKGPNETVYLFDQGYFSPGVHRMESTRQITPRFALEDTTLAGGHWAILSERGAIQGDDIYGAFMTDFNNKRNDYDGITNGVFRLNKSGIFTQIASFPRKLFRIDNDRKILPPEKRLSVQQSAPVFGTDGSIYGTSYFGGSADYGFVFRLSKPVDRSLTLSMQRSGDHLILMWPGTSDSILQFREDWRPGSSWSNLSETPPIKESGMFIVRVYPTKSAQFFRLSSP